MKNSDKILKLIFIKQNMKNMINKNQNNLLYKHIMYKKKFLVYKSDKYRS